LQFCFKKDEKFFCPQKFWTGKKILIFPICRSALKFFFELSMENGMGHSSVLALFYFYKN